MPWVSLCHPTVDPDIFVLSLNNLLNTLLFLLELAVLGCNQVTSQSSFWQTEEPELIKSLTKSAFPGPLIILCIDSPPWLVYPYGDINRSHVGLTSAPTWRFFFLPNCSFPQRHKRWIRHLPPNHTNNSQSVPARADWTVQIYTHKIVFRVIVFKTLCVLQELPAFFEAADCICLQ